MMCSLLKKITLAGVLLSFPTISNNGLEILQKKYPWPYERPSVPVDMHGWFYNQAQLEGILTAKMTLIVELGSWLGSSTRFILDHAENAVVIAVDHWKGDADITHSEDLSKIPTLYETFITNCWQYRKRLIPVKNTTLNGLQEVFDCGLIPDLVYVDASHDYDSVTKDLEKTYKLFPSTIITGDDWESPVVSKAAKDFVNRHNMTAATPGNWR